MSRPLRRALGYYGGSVAVGLAPRRPSRIPMGPTYRARFQGPRSSPWGFSPKPIPDRGLSPSSGPSRVWFRAWQPIA